MNTLVPLPVAIPLLTAALLSALNRHMPRRVADALAIAATVATGGVSCVLMLESRQQPILYWFGGWTPRAGVALGVSFLVDPIGAGLCVFTSVLMLAALVFSLKYFDSVGTLFHALMLGYLTGMCGFSLTADLFNLFVFFELMSATAFALCGYKNEEPTAQQGALNFAITNTIGAFCILIGIGMLYSRTGALNLAQIGRALGSQTDGLVLFAFVLIMCGFFVKAAVVPFHFWLADAHAVAPTPVCVLFSGVMVELGIYGVARVYWSLLDGAFAPHRHALMWILLVAGTLTALGGGIMCFGQRHLKRLLAFSTISHVGLLVIALALLKPDAIAGAALYTLGHGFVKGALFLLAGLILHRFGSVDQSELHGKARDMRWTAIVFGAAALGLAGLPGFGTFAGEHVIEHAAGADGLWWLDVVFFLAAVLTAAAVLRIGAHIFFGWGPVEDRATKGSSKIEEKRETSGSKDIPISMFVAALSLAVLGLSVGLYPGLEQHVRGAAFTMADAAGYQARVLDGATLPALHPAPSSGGMAGSLLRAFAAVIASFALAALTLLPDWPKRKKKAYLVPIRWPLQALRSVHTGHVGDYVAFLTFGIAGIGLALALLVRVFGV